jgi:hypothetical protein
MFKKTKSQLQRERLEDIEYQRRMRAGDVNLGEGRVVSDPTNESPCPFHESWHPPRRLPTQPRSLLECPVCLAEAGATRKRARDEEVEELAHPQYPRGDGRMAQAWADHLAAHKDELIASGSVALVDKKLEAEALDHIDVKRYNELSDLAESPTVSALFMNRMRKRRKYWRL